MALMNYLTDEEIGLIMKKAEECTDAKSLGDQLNYGILKLHEEGYKFKGISVLGGRIFKEHYIGVLGPIGQELLDNVLSQYR